MRPIYVISRILVVLLAIALTIFLAQIVLQGKIIFSRQPDIPTAVSKTDFVVEIPQKALWKNYVVVSAQTFPSTNCELLYIPPSGEIQKMDTTAENNGLCIWRWKVKELDGKGNARLIFTIGGKSETHFIEIRSSF